MNKTNLQLFQESTCYACGYCQERKCKDESELDIRDSGAIKIWCYAVDDVRHITFGDCYIKKTTE